MRISVDSTHSDYVFDVTRRNGSLLESRGRDVQRIKDVACIFLRKLHVYSVRSWAKRSPALFSRRGSKRTATVQWEGLFWEIFPGDKFSHWTIGLRSESHRNNSVQPFRSQTCHYGRAGLIERDSTNAGDAISKRRKCKSVGDVKVRVKRTIDAQQYHARWLR